MRYCDVCTAPAEKVAKFTTPLGERKTVAACGDEHAQKLTDRVAAGGLMVGPWEYLPGPHKP